MPSPNRPRIHNLPHTFAVTTLRFSLLLAIAPLLAAQQTAKIEVLPVQGNIYMLAGAGANITLQLGDNGVLVVDTGLAPMSAQVIAEIRKLSQKQLRYVVNTDVHEDHTGGNEAFSKEGGTSTVVNIVNTPGQTASQAIKIVGHEGILDRMSASVNGKPARVSLAWPTDTFFDEPKEFYFNGESIQVLHQPAAITDGDSLVYFRRSDVVSTGDIFMTTGYPNIDLPGGGGIQGVLDALNRILDLTIPAHHEEGGTMVIPGHGRLCDEADVMEYRDMVTVIRDRIRAMVKKGSTIEQIVASRPTMDYDGLYDVSRQSADAFVETVYKSLTEKTK
ncbi:MAG TPA: MBL fold metallo-hydrolase [Bryobacteraceae bacterium]|nr:MBL fold metallo-hydrolase [Bryobacteraceae bacterium]